MRETERFGFFFDEIGGEREIYIYRDYGERGTQASILSFDVIKAGFKGQAKTKRKEGEDKKIDSLKKNVWRKNDYNRDDNEYKQDRILLFIFFFPFSCDSSRNKLKPRVEISDSDVRSIDCENDKRKRKKSYRERVKDKRVKPENEGK